MARRRVALLGLVTALALVAAHAALAAVSASFTCSPSCSVAPGTTITFTSNSTGGIGNYEWDLDGDGLYGAQDNPDEPFGTSQESAQKNFPTAGTFTVGLRVTEFGTGAMDTETKTITVGGSPPPPPPPVNKPPKATIDFQCDELPPGSQSLLCPGVLGLAGKPKTFDASPSSDPDGQVVKYEWDFDNNGSFEKSGSSPLATHTFKDAGTANYKLRVTDDDGATNVAALFVIVKAGCQSKVTFKRLTATSTCLKRTLKTSGQGFKVAKFTSQYTTKVNGLIVKPAAGKSVRVEGLVNKDGDLLNAFVKSTNASVYVKVEGKEVRIHKGALSWGVAEKGTKLSNFKLANFNGLKATGLVGPTLSQDKVSSRIEFYLALPNGMGGATSGKRVVLTPGKGANAAAGAFSFKVENGSLGPIGLKKLSISYDGDGLWEIAGKVALPSPIPYSLAAGLGIDGGEFSYGEAEVDFGSPGIGPFGPVFIQRIKFRIELKPRPDKPSTSKCVPKIGIEHFNVDTRVMHKLGIHRHPAEIIDIDHGIPDFALCGEVRLTGGPNILGVAAIRLDAGLGFATYGNSRPAVLRAFGKLFLVEIPIAQANFEVHTNGYAKMKAEFKAGIDDVATLEGFIKFEMYLPKFNAEAFIEACVGPVDLCAGARALISGKGVAICLHLPLGWEPGVGYKWGGSLTIYWSGCEVGPYKQQINASSAALRVRAAGAEQAVQVPAGLPGTVITTTGQGAPPKITVVGPSGQTYTTPDGDKAVQTNAYWLMKDRRANTTSFAIVKPQPGRWIVRTDDDSVPVTSIQKADGLDRPTIRASVRGRGHRRILSYRIKKEAGDRVTFLEDGPSAGRRIGVARGSRGRIRFTPADGKRERRGIVAVVERDGFVADRFRLLTYSAPGPFRPARPGKLRARRRGRTIRLRWRRSAGARRYEVKVALSDGRRLLLLPRRNGVVVRRVGRRVRARITVRGVSEAGIKGRAARANVGKPKRRSGSRR